MHRAWNPSGFLAYFLILKHVISADMARIVKVSEAALALCPLHDSSEPDTLMSSCILWDFF